MSKKKQKKKPDKEQKLLTRLAILTGIVTLLQGIANLIDTIAKLIKALS